MKIHKGDTVQVIAGKDSGRKGKVLVAYPKAEKLLVEGANRVKKHTKVQATGRGGQTGGIITQEAPIHVSNVMIVCPSCDKPVRVGYRWNAEGEKVRTCRGKDCEGDL